jgi:two-component system chemotaxis response regulator CheB
MLPASRAIRVLIVDDSASFRKAMALALGSDPRIEVVGQAADGGEAVALCARLKPDVVTMDVVMPVLDGIEASRLILARSPVPILLMTTLASVEEQRVAMNALRIGVVDVTNKPVLAGPGAAAGIAQVIQHVKSAATAAAVGALVRRARAPRTLGPESHRGPLIITVAASTGGPPALESVLGPLAGVCPPIVVAQHLAPSFSRGFLEWLGAALGRPVIAVQGAEPLRPGSIYVAAEKQHLRIADGVVRSAGALSSDLTPNADLLFQSTAAAYGSRAIGIVLTGMGNDGAMGLRAMRQAGAWTIGQDRDSSVVYGMPRAAAEADALCEILPLDEIGARLASLVSGEPADRGGA